MVVATFIIAAFTVVMAVTVIYYTKYTKKLWEETKAITTLNLINSWFDPSTGAGASNIRQIKNARDATLKVAFQDKDELRKIFEA